MTLKIRLQNGEMIERYYSTNSSRFSSQDVPAFFQLAYVKVLYGSKVCSLGCKCQFTNWGEYTTKQELVKAIRSFQE